MIREAVVIRENGRLMAEVTRTEACMTCRACNFGLKERMLVPIDGEGFQEGDPVEIEMETGGVGKVSMIAYGIPVLTLLLGLVVGSALFSQEWVQALCALAGCALGVVAAMLFDRKIRQNGKYKPVVRPLGQSGRECCGK